MPLTDEVQGMLAILNSLVVDEPTLSSYLDNETVPTSLVELAEQASANPAGSKILPAWRQLCSFVRTTHLSDDPIFEEALTDALFSALEPADETHEVRKKLFEELGLASHLIS